MLKIKRILRLSVLYITSVVLISSPSAAVFAEDETYTYDPATGRWNSTKWVYDPATGVYVPANAPQSPPPAPEQSTEPEEEEESVDSSVAEIDNAGPSSNNQASDNSETDSTTNINNGTTVTNDIDSNATTGDAGVKQNSNGGDAQTGNANADATIVNSVHSTVGSGENSGVANFTIDLYGDVHGDIVIGPSTFANTEVDKNKTFNSETNINNNDSITNNVDLSAQSGDAEVSGNTAAGSAQSGDARAVANLLNLVNTVIAANKSFVGTINIHGNMYGDILLSPEFIPQLIGSNAVSDSTSDLAVATHINDDKTIVNNIELEATSGTATVKDNTSAGDASTGDAQTSLQILNLTGHEVVAENSILVFVNVKGKWVGLIMDAPGATAAAFGTGVVSHNINANSTTNVNSKTAITNNIKLSAASGDATVAGNTSAGGAKTGDAYAGACIANIIGSKFILSGFFAVLCINIDEDFIGKVRTTSDQVVSAAGFDTPPPSSPNLSNVSIKYVAHQNKSAQPAGVSTEAVVDGAGYAEAVLASAMKQQPQQQTSSFVPVQSSRVDPFSEILMYAGLGILGVYGAWWAVRRFV